MGLVKHIFNSMNSIWIDLLGWKAQDEKKKRTV